MIKDAPILAVTPGEPAGIGPECFVRLAHQHPGLRLLAVADRSLLQSTAEALGINIDISDWSPGDPVNAGRPACLHRQLAAKPKTGRLDPANAAYVVDTITTAVSLVRSGHAAALLTGPVHKGVINDGGIAFSGHTELLAELAGVKKVVMMLAADELRVALVTTHLPLRDVADAITTDNVRQTIEITHDALVNRFGIEKPVIQVLGLNPHAGEGGHLGSEDQQIIEPLIESCRAKGIGVIGPVPADTAFNRSRLANCDAVIAMYHDQGLPVLKHAGFGKAVNITLGLPFIRTSVDHGTALDIAANYVADPSSMFAAARAAQDMCR